MLPVVVRPPPGGDAPYCSWCNTAAMSAFVQSHHDASVESQ